MHLIDSNENLKLNEELKDCIEELKEEQRQTVHLFYFESKSYRDISQETGWDDKKVKSLLQNGKRNLKIG